MLTLRQALYGTGYALITQCSDECVNRYARYSFWMSCPVMYHPRKDVPSSSARPDR